MELNNEVEEVRQASGEANPAAPQRQDDVGLGPETDFTIVSIMPSSPEMLLPSTPDRPERAPSPPGTPPATPTIVRIPALISSTRVPADPLGQVCQGLDESLISHERPEKSVNKVMAKSLDYSTYPVSLKFGNESTDASALTGIPSSSTGISFTSTFSKSTRASHRGDMITVLDEEHGATLSSELEPHTDPFAFREGRTLTWQNVNMSLATTKKGKPARKLLDNVWGEVPKKETTAILGASGAGKTSLLNILAGRLQTNQRLRIKADVRLNNYTVDPTDINVRHNIAFVAQDDSLQITATPREAIRFSAKMRLPRTTTEKQLDQLTTRMLCELGLTDCADTIVGGALIKGISGGERKRTSVGVELVVRPTMVFLDEPTSGLDSFSAEQCCEVLRKVAQAGASVLFTIHQPASEVFAAFDHLILMNKGRVMYQGPVKGIPDFFGGCGYAVPRNYNPADWIIDVAQGVPIKILEEAAFFPQDDRKMGAAFTPEKGKDVLGRTVHSNENIDLQEPCPGTLTQIGMLFRREMLHICRDWTVLAARVVLMAILAFFIGMIFFEVGQADQRYRMNVQSQFGALVTVLVTAMISTSQIALFSFPEERPVFLREYSTNHYSVLSYFVAHLTTEFVLTAVQIGVLVVLIYYLVGFNGTLLQYFLSTFALAMTTTAQAVFGSCLCGGNTKLAMQMLPLLFTPQMLFSGFFVSPDLIPSWLSWAPYICTMTYSTRILVVAEFEDCSANRAELVNCNDMITSTDSNPDDVWWYWLALIVLFVVFRVAALAVLQRSALKFY